MRTISDSVYELLMAQGLARGTAATVGPCENKSPALSTMASSGGVKADAAGGMHRPIGPHAGGGKAGPILNSGKDRGNVTPAKFTVLTCKAPNAHGRRKKAPGTYLRLVWSR